MGLLQTKCIGSIRVFLIVLSISVEICGQGFMQEDNIRAVYFKLDITEGPEIDFSELKDKYEIEINAELSIYLSASLEKRLSSRTEKFELGEHDLFIFQFSAEVNSLSYATLNFSEVKDEISKQEIDSLESFAYKQIIENKINSVQIIPVYFDKAKELIYFNGDEILWTQFKEFKQRVIIPSSFSDSIIVTDTFENKLYTRYNMLFYDVNSLPQISEESILKSPPGADLPDTLNLVDSLTGLKRINATMFNMPDSVLLFYEVENRNIDSLSYYAFSSIVTPSAAIENGYRTVTADTLFFSNIISNQSDLGSRDLVVLFPQPMIQENDIRVATLPDAQDTLNLYTESGARNLVERQVNVLAEVSNFRNILSHSFRFDNNAINVIDSLGLQNIATRGAEELRIGDLARDQLDSSIVYLPIFTTTQIEEIRGDSSDTNFNPFYTGIIIIASGLATIALAFL